MRKCPVAEGKGDEGDALNVVWVMDTAQFPFYRAERYHQFRPSIVLMKRGGGNYEQNFSATFHKISVVKKKVPILADFILNRGSFLLSHFRVIHSPVKAP